MPHSPLSRYRQLVEQCQISFDPGQRAVVERLQELYERLSTTPESSQRQQRLMARFFGHSRQRGQPAVKGIYLWGGVGRGKSMLMDMFYQSLDIHHKRRVHFHGFMLEVHAAIHRLRQDGEEDPLIRVAEQIAADYRVLCFDELQVHDITDAMILARLFSILVERGVTVLFTSNRPPEDLYLHGLQRERFLPFIALIRSHMEVLDIKVDQDYRRWEMAGITTRYLTPDTPETRRELAQEFSRMIGYNSTPERLDIPVRGRMLVVPAACRDVAWFSFADLCEQPLGAADYLELVQLFRVIFIEGIPAMDATMRNEAKRFVTLIDILYEAQTLLFCTAQTEPEALYGEGEGSFEFARTASRLREMMADDVAGA